MSIQTTHYVTREEAERLYVQKQLNEWEEKFKVFAKASTDTELEDFIESEFDNFTIVKSESEQ